MCNKTLSYLAFKSKSEVDMLLLWHLLSNTPQSNSCQSRHESGLNSLQWISKRMKYHRVQFQKTTDLVCDDEVLRRLDKKGNHSCKCWMITTLDQLYTASTLSLLIHNIEKKKSIKLQQILARHKLLHHLLPNSTQMFNILICHSLQSFCSKCSIWCSYTDW